MYQVYNDEYLAHHGIKGMHWGIRRFRNRDGSLTAAGRARYDVDLKKSKQAVKNAKARYSSSGRIGDKAAYKAAKAAYRNDKIKNKLNQETKKSQHRLNLEKKYMAKGLTQEEAEVAAYKRARAEKIIAACAATTIVAVGAYLAANEIDRRTDKIVSDKTQWKRIASDDSKELHDVFYQAHGRDAQKYEGLYGAQKGYGQYGDIFQKTIRTSGLKVASQERGRQALQEALTGDSSLKKDFVYNVKARAYNPYLGPKQQGLAKRALRDLNAGKVTPAVYDIFNSEIVGTHGEDPLSQKVFSSLKKQGFHAIEDMNDRKYSGYGAKSATIVFDKSRATVESVRKVSTKEITEKAKYEMKVIQGKTWVKSRLAMAGAGVAIGAGVKANRTRKENTVVANYRKQHPNTELSYEQILQAYYKKK